MADINTETEQARNLMLGDWYAVLAQLWNAFGKPLDPDQFDIYASKLKDIPLGVLEQVVDETISRHRFNSVPVLAEVLDVLVELHPNHEAYTLADFARLKSTPSEAARNYREKERLYAEITPKAV